LLALSRVIAYGHQQQVDSLLGGYLAKYGTHIDSISLEGEDGPEVRQLPQSLTKLSSLAFDNSLVQMLPGDGYQGVLGAAAAAPLPLKQLRLNNSKVLDSYEGREGLKEFDGGLMKALALLPGLEHLSIIECDDSHGGSLCIPLGEVLPGLQQLTFLELDLELGVDPDTDDDSSEEGEDAAPMPHPTAVQMQHLSTLTRLADLRLPQIVCRFTAGMLSGVQTLTRLQLSGPYTYAPFDPAALAGKTLLQHLGLHFKALLDSAPGVQLLAQLQLQQKLTCLQLGVQQSLRDIDPRSLPPAAAIAALTASSKLQCLDVSGCRLPEGVWQHMFPVGRQLPYLRVVGISAAAPDGTRLVSCCPALEALTIRQVERSRELLSSLQELSGLHTLHLEHSSRNSEGLPIVVVQLTGLRELKLIDVTNIALLQLTQLRQLTSLEYRGPVYGRGDQGIFKSEVRFCMAVVVCSCLQHRRM
jgi:hypothetical protein